MIEQTTFYALQPGIHLVVLGAVHGDEHCGPVAIKRFIEALQLGEVELLEGAVSFVPVCNPKAYEQKRRFVERNLNRALYVKEYAPRL